MNPMRNLRIAKVTLNFGAGKNPQLLEKGSLLLERIAGKAPVQVVTQKRVPNWGLRPGLPIGAKITVRGAKADEIIRSALTAKEQTLTERNFDKEGNVAFGIPEYIEISGMKYDPDIGMLGFQLTITLERAGYRIKTRRLRPARVPHRHRVTKEEAMAFMKERFGVSIQ